MEQYEFSFDPQHDVGKVQAGLGASAAITFDGPVPASQKQKLQGALSAAVSPGYDVHVHATGYGYEVLLFQEGVLGPDADRDLVGETNRAELLRIATGAMAQSPLKPLLRILHNLHVDLGDGNEAVGTMAVVAPDGTLLSVAGRRKPTEARLLTDNRIRGKLKSADCGKWLVSLESDKRTERAHIMAGNASEQVVEELFGRLLPLLDLELSVLAFVDEAGNICVLVDDLLAAIRDAITRKNTKT